MSVPLRSSRNERAFERGSLHHEALLVGYLMAGDPDLAGSLRLIQDSVIAGIDILEIGVPSADPVCDGDIIRRSHARVQDSGEFSRPAALHRFWADLRRTVAVPIWAMGYRHDLLETGLYLELARNHWIDGLVLPDCDRADWRQIAPQVGAYGIDVVRFANSAMNDQELAETTADAGIVYAQLYQGRTGDPVVRQDDAAAFYDRIRKHSPAWAVAGFGVRSPEKVREIVRAGFTGVVVGTALVARVESGAQDGLYRLISDLKMATRQEPPPGLRHEEEHHGIYCDI